MRIVVVVGAAVFVGIVESCVLRVVAIHVRIDVVVVVHVQVRVLEMEQLPEVQEQELEHVLEVQQKMVQIALVLDEIAVRVRRHEVVGVPDQYVQDTRVMHSSPNRSGAHTYLQNYYLS